MPWTMQRAYLEGLEADGTISREGGGPDAMPDGMPAAGEGGPVRRQAEAGADVIDLASMRADLERQRGGDR